jgi:hypothetical protein
MSKQLKGIIFSIGDVLAPKNNQHTLVFDEIKKLFLFLISKGIQPVILANRDVCYQGVLVDKLLQSAVGTFPCFMTLRDNLPRKPKKDAIDHVLSKMGWDVNEAAYVGSTEDDMKTATNGEILFLNAQWFGQGTDYGIKFDAPRDIARFVDIFCLNNLSWGFVINQDGIEFYSLSVFSTFKPIYALQSEDARAVAKLGVGNLDFWTKFIWTKIYFSELYKKIDFIIPFPGHNAAKISIAATEIQEPIQAFGKCFKIEFLSDLIIRHTTSVKSQTARNAGDRNAVNHKNQLNTIHLNKFPLKTLGQGKGKPYKKAIELEGKTVLVVDDICTAGYSLDAARIFLEMAGARVILLSWLKTINTDYKQVYDLPPFDPFKPATFTGDYKEREHSYRSHLKENSANEVTRKFNMYKEWDWPT